jgi:large subunit ribosomal protein L4e
MKANVFDKEGKKTKTMELPEIFSQSVREDILSRVLETKKSQQPYAPSPVAGKQSAARGKLVHRRHVWKTQYGKSLSRVPRKVFSRRGEQFNWEAAEVPSARGGMRAHPPKIESMIKIKRINKKEAKIALISALSATANEKEIRKKYSSLENEKIEAPFVVEEKLLTLKTKNILDSLKKILGEKLFSIAVRMLLVIGKGEKVKTNAFDVKEAGRLSVLDLAEGGAGRIAVYTEKSIKELAEKLK